jgi:gliding motility-associated lipoprotein GldH
MIDYLTLKPMKTPIRILAIILVVTVLSCQNPTVINEYRAIPVAGWGKTENAKFNFEISDTQRYHNLFINLRITGDYPFCNMYVLVHIHGPEGSHSAERVGLTLATPEGKWLGRGMGDVISYQLPLITNKVFGTKGKYTIEIEQYMRTDILPYVRDVGLMVETGEEII